MHITHFNSSNLVRNLHLDRDYQNYNQSQRKIQQKENQSLFHKISLTVSIHVKI